MKYTEIAKPYVWSVEVDLCYSGRMGVKIQTKTDGVRVKFASFAALAIDPN